MDKKFILTTILMLFSAPAMAEISSIWFICDHPVSASVVAYGYATLYSQDDPIINTSIPLPLDCTLLFNRPKNHRLVWLGLIYEIIRAWNGDSIYVARVYGTHLQGFSAGYLY